MNKGQHRTMRLLMKINKHCLSCGLLIVVAGLSSCKETRSRLNEVSAQSSLRLIRQAETTYRSQNRDRFGTLQELHSAALIDAELASGTKRGYRYDLRVGHDSYIVTAVPIEYDVTGSWAFYLDESGVIRGSPTKGKTPGINDRPINNQ